MLLMSISYVTSVLAYCSYECMLMLCYLYRVVKPIYLPPFTSVLLFSLNIGARGWALEWHLRQYSALEKRIFRLVPFTLLTKRLPPGHLRGVWAYSWSS